MGPHRSSHVIGLAAFGLAVLFVVYAVARRGPRALPGLAFVVVAAWAACGTSGTSRCSRSPGSVPRPAISPPRRSPSCSRRRAPAAWPRTLLVISVAVGVALLVVALPRQPFRLRIPAQGSDLAAGVVVYPAGAVAYLAETGSGASW